MQTIIRRHFRVSPFSSPRHFDITTKKSITELTLAAILLNAKNLVRERRERKEPERQDESGTPERRYVEFSCVVSMSRGDILPRESLSCRCLLLLSMQFAAGHPLLLLTPQPPCLTSGRLPLLSARPSPRLNVGHAVLLSARPSTRLTIHVCYYFHARSSRLSHRRPPLLSARRSFC